MTEQDSHDLASLPIHQLSKALGDRSLTSTQLVEALLARIERLDPKLHAFVEVYTDEALGNAAAADATRASGAARGPLHGIPIALKDIIDVAGRVTTAGSLVWNQRPSASAVVVDQLTAAGMIILGKTHTVEFAMGGWGTNQHKGAPWNPWDTEVARTPGGSSSGSAVAVAARLVPCALGTDTGGSLRMPASWCGIVGFKPTVGRIDTAGVVPLSATLDTLGPLTRSVEDAALLYQVLRDRGPGQAPTTPELLSQMREGARGLRVARINAAERALVDTDTLAAYDESLEVLRRLGAEVVDVDLPRSFAEFAKLVADVMIPEGYANFAHLLDDPSLPIDNAVRARLMPGRDMSAAAYIRALETRTRVKSEFASALAGVAAMVTPSTTTSAIKLSDVDESKAPSHFTRAVNYLDLCAVALPNGFTRTGLPLSLQVIGKSHDESTALRIAWALEQATEWHLRAPSL
jgi:aspartyl-tRNA(Asn)/glutamyl-tRNA(Gln) amidotransferase subunit A